MSGEGMPRPRTPSPRARAGWWPEPPSRGGRGSSLSPWALTPRGVPPGTKPEHLHVWGPRGPEGRPLAAEPQESLEGGAQASACPRTAQTRAGTSGRQTGGGWGEVPVNFPVKEDLFPELTGCQPPLPGPGARSPASPDTAAPRMGERCPHLRRLSHLEAAVGTESPSVPQGSLPAVLRAVPGVLG